ncbi:MAG: hypothetical protein N2037_03300 [Acidimicrobiales bacterium]|nr:hypothetical protein [Acidimicrobiales bacterium]
MYDVTVDPADEYFHTPGPEPLWNESWYFDFFTEDGSLGGYVRLGRYPNSGVIWYWACIVGSGRPLVTVIDNAVPIPTNPRSHELHGAMLWADHNCETPLEHWSLGLETHAIALDDPADVYGKAYGDRTPLAFELDWHTDGLVFTYPSSVTPYEIPCRVSGTVDVGAEHFEFEGFGQRDHSWGIRDWWSMGWCWTAFRLDDGSRWHAVTPKPQSLAPVGYEQLPGQQTTGRSHLRYVTEFCVLETLGPSGIPRSAELVMVSSLDPDGGGARSAAFQVEPIAWSPVLLTDPTGRRSRLPRGLCRFVGERGSGIGWIEFNQPELVGQAESTAIGSVE